MRIKKILVCILVLILCIGATACGDTDMSNEREDAIKDLTQSAFSAIHFNFSNAETAEEMQQAIISYLTSYIQANNASDITYETEGTSIYIKNNADGDAQGKGVLLYCSYSLNTKQQSSEVISMALAAVLSVTGDTDVSLLITYGDNYDYSSLADLVLNYDESGGDLFDVDTCINMSYATDPAFYNNSASVDFLEYKSDVTVVPVEDMKTYRITISNFERENTAASDKDRVNPITTIYNFLSSCNNNHYNYIVSSFTSGGSYYDYPSSAQLIISISPSDTTKFENSLNTSRDNFLNKVDDYNVIPTYIIEEIDPVTEGISSDDVTQLVSLMFTVNDSFEYLNENEEEDVVGQNVFTNMRFTTEGSKVVVCSRYMAPTDRDERLSIFNDLGELNGYTFKHTIMDPLWICTADETLTRLTEIADDKDLDYDISSTFANTEAGILFQANNGMELLSMGSNIQYSDHTVLTLVSFIESITEVE